MMEPLPCHEVNISKVKMGWVTMTTLISSTTSVHHVLAIS